MLSIGEEEECWRSWEVGRRVAAFQMVAAREARRAISSCLVWWMEAMERVFEWKERL